MDLIGQMDAVITFHRNTGQDSGAGGKDRYEELVTTRGYLKKGGGSRTGSFAEVLGSNSWTLIVRKQTVLADAFNDPTYDVMAIKVTDSNNRRFTIQAPPEDMNEDHFYYKIMLAELTK